MLAWPFARVAGDTCVLVSLAQDARRIEVWRRTEADAWSHSTYTAGQSVELASIRGSLAVDELYAEAGLSVP